MLHLKTTEKYGFPDLVSIMAVLRGEGGCPWDREQTHASIRRNFIEEVYEACEAIDLCDDELLAEELGDVLLQVVFHARIAEEAGGFAIGDVTDGICRKLIERHPHIFGGLELKTGGAAEVLSNWEDIKNASKQKDAAAAVGGVAKSLPALIRADKTVGRAARAGAGIPPADKLAERISETAAKIAAEGDGGLLGALLLDAVRLARSLGVDPESALSKETDKFIAE